MSSEEELDRWSEIHSELMALRTTQSLEHQRMFRRLVSEWKYHESDLAQLMELADSRYDEMIEVPIGVLWSVKTMLTVLKRLSDESVEMAEKESAKTDEMYAAMKEQS